MNDQHPQAENDEEMVSPPELEQFYIVFLRRPDNPPQYTDEELQKIQGRHLAHLQKMGEMGMLLIAGPLADPTEKLRGICICRADSLEEVKAYAEKDPAVQAGRLEVEVMPWYTPKGRLAINTDAF